MTDYDAILFDNDGVLVEPPGKDTLCTAAEAAFRVVGVEDPADEHVVETTTGITMDRLRDFSETYDLDPEAFWEARDRHASDAQRDEFRDGARDRYDDVTAIEALTYDFGLVSSNQHETIEFILDYCDFGDRFETYYGRKIGVESLDRKKPNPYFLERALADLGAESALYVGDSESDVVAAKRAGLDSAFIRRDHCADVALSVEPTYEVETLHEVAEIATQK